MRCNVASQQVSVESEINLGYHFTHSDCDKKAKKSLRRNLAILGYVVLRVGLFNL